MRLRLRRLLVNMVKSRTFFYFGGLLISKLCLYVYAFNLRR